MVYFNPWSPFTLQIHVKSELNKKQNAFQMGPRGLVCIQSERSWWRAVWLSWLLEEVLFSNRIRSQDSKEVVTARAGSLSRRGGVSPGDLWARVEDMPLEVNGWVQAGPPLLGSQDCSTHSPERGACEVPSRELSGRFLAGVRQAPERMSVQHLLRDHRPSKLEGMLGLVYHRPSLQQVDAPASVQAPSQPCLNVSRANQLSLFAGNFLVSSENLQSPASWEDGTP